MKKFFSSLILVTALAAPAPANDYQEFKQAVAATAAMVRDNAARSLAALHDLTILNVTWEDTGRYGGSSVGPNISDMTLQVQLKDPATGEQSLTCLPVIRYDNFTDQTADVGLDDFFLLVGNEKGLPARKVSLREYLDSPRRFMSNPDSWPGSRHSLLADRDSHVLVSAQACFLPIPKGGEVEFNPVLFNYQSVKEDPAVLTILATREGTSMTIIDNTRDGFAAGRTWGQRLFFNQSGERSSLTGTRLSDFDPQPGEPAEGGVQAGGEEGLNMVLLIQVPLKQKNPPRFNDMLCYEAAGAVPKTRVGSNVEDAVIGHGEVEGPFTEVDGVEIERDERFPIRVTVQFYKATDNGVVSRDDMASLASQIERVYEDADYVGSLVTNPDGERPTEYDGPKTEPAGWWSDFYRRHRWSAGMAPDDVVELFRMLGLRAR